ncbi:type I polyketide synthase, partial [Actinoplanes sp. NPDC049265]|uniref:type I polyketide synthase n=1 Tax=Actinoplanes sp. NPDC049265 TaxID=3363902 RepID=UPI0037169FA9
MSDESKLREYLDLVTTNLRQTRRRLQEVEGRSHEPVAIVGMGCRFPGGVGDPEELWGLLASGGDAVGPLPGDRGWDLEALYDPDPDHLGTSYARAGGFVAEAAEFDAGFFGISPREAAAMDPQQRLLLEVCWEALERAGIDPGSLRGSPAGVFAGAAGYGYGTVGQGEAAEAEGYGVTGGAGSVISGRVSYVLGLEGPAMTVDTACSSSLVALHLASQALRAGECDLALAGGVTVMSTPATLVEFSRQRGLAQDGRCKAFGAGADGMGMSEGAGMLVLMRLSDAQRAGHRVLAVIRGSAVNHDGASNGLTAPNGPSQQRVIAAALAAARLSASDVDAVEAHGTGTRLGDPIEAQALIANYGQGREDRPLWLGSVKSNIGHTQAAAGVAGVMKMVLALQHEVLPETLHAEEPSPRVDWSAGDVRLLSAAQPWPVNGRLRRAGVSSFGISGTNAHLILEEAAASEVAGEQAPAEATDQVLTPGGPVAWPVSGRDAAGLAAQVARLGEFVAARPGLDPVDVGFSLAVTRAALGHRAVVVGADREELLAAQPVTGVAVTGGRTVLVFPGQGSQWAGMGAELRSVSPVFATAFDRVCSVLEEILGLPVAEVVLGRDENRLNETVFAQAGLFAIGVGLARLLEAAGVVPDVVVGHSVGEIAAAHVAGVLSLEDACGLVAARGRLMQQLPSGGAMAAIAASEAEVKATIDHFDGRVVVAAVNGPMAVTVSGETGPVQQIAASWRERGRQATVLSTSRAFHSPAMDAVLEPLERVAVGLTYHEPRMTVVSTLTGAVVSGDDLQSAGYWAEQARRPVRFADAITTAAGLGGRVFIEAGPDGALTTLGPDCVPDDAGQGSVFVAVQRRNRPAARQFLTALASAYVTGVAVDWAAVTGPARRVELPTYAFQRSRYWLQPPPAPAAVVGAGSVGEARFWTAVEDGDERELAAALRADRGEVAAVLPALAAWRRRDRETAVAEGWLYRVDWESVPALPAAALAGTWLVVLPDAVAGELTRAVTTALARHGAQVVTATAVSADREQMSALLDETLPDAGAGLAGVLSLLALPETAAVGGPGSAGGLAGTLTLLQALTDAGVTAPVWAVTSGAVAAGPDETPTHVAGAQVWALGRVAALEAPGLWGGLIDLPESLDERAARRLCQVLAGTGEDQVAVRGFGVLVRRLARAAIARGVGPDSWQARGTVLVTGGTEALGGHTAEWLARSGAQHTLLATRSGPAAPGTAVLAARIAAAGADVTVTACDATERTELTALIAGIPASRPLTTVVHAAGTPDDGVLDALDAGKLAALVDPEVATAQLLDELTEELDLDAFLLFSSGSTVIGGVGRGSDAAANAFQDVLALRRRARGLPATSVAWGSWADADADADADAGADAGAGAERERLARHGVRTLDPGLALAALGQALSRGETSLTVADIDWEQFAPAFTAGRPSPLLKNLPEAGQTIATADTVPAAGLAGQLAGLPPAGQEALLVDLVRAQAAAVLGHGSPEAVGPARPFRDQGFDSLTAVDLRNRLAAVTGLRLPATAIFDYPAPAVLGRHLRTELVGESGSASDVPVPTAAMDEPVAIVGMGCRFPGGVGSPEELWGLLAEGGDAVGPFPDDRGWDLEGLFDPDPDHAGTSYARTGGFVAEAAEFDAGFFGISPREAVGMDPQQRLLLEVSWEALERAGIDPGTLRGTAAGVFAGATGYGYAAGAEGYGLTGIATSVLSGRVSYVLGLEGPAMTVDTACSSSLVAMHLAAQALRAGECDLALAGGVTVMATPATFVEFSRQRGLAPDGRCKAFGADADGTGWAEGAGMLVLMRLSDAQRAGHPVLAVVRGSAVNQDGASNGLTAPNGPSQQRVIRSALAGARLVPSDVDVVEAHGTGTTLGDPIEAQALIATYGQGRSGGEPLWLGSVKSNIGHTQAAAGVAGVMKMVLAMRHGVLPATLHVDEPSPHVDWTAGSVRLLSAARSWPVGGRLRRAGVSSFGISGTNAHVILEEAPVPEEVAVRAPASGGSVAWLVSGRDAVGLAAQAGRLGEFVAARPGLDPVDVGYSLAVTRAALDHRAVVTGADRDELLARLALVAAGRPGAGVVTGTAVGRSGKTVLVFPGQGSQWAGMGRELRSASPVFAAVLDQVCGILGGLLDLPVTDVVLGQDEARLNETVFAQAGLFAVGVALARLLEASGVVPDVVLGHSVGEIAAVHVAGMLSLEDACGLVAARGRLMQGLPAGGAMAAVAAGEAEVVASLERFGGRVVVAAVNGPSAVTVSGEADAVEQVVAWWRELGRKATVLSTSRAFHSPAMDPVMESLERVAAGLFYHEPQVTVVSTLTGAVASVEDFGAPGYWAAQARQPVRFADAVAAAAALGGRVFVEAGPDGALTTLGPDCVPDGLFVAVQRRNRPAAGQFLTALAGLFVEGLPVDWAKVVGPARKVELPTYAFQHTRYWLHAASKTGDVASVGLGSAGHPLLGAEVELASGDGLLLTGRLSLADQPWLADHVLLGAVVVPGAALAEMAVAAGERAGCGRVEELVLRAPLVIPAGETVQVQVTVGAPETTGVRSVAVHARVGVGTTDWTEHATGALAPAGPIGNGWDEGQWPPAGTLAVDISGIYEDLAENGYEYGPTFRGLRAVWRREEEAFAEVRLPEDAGSGQAGLFEMHPAVLDAVLHAVSPGEVLPDGRALIPFAWRGVQVHAAGATAVRVRLRRVGPDAVRLQAADAAGRPVLTVDSLTLRPVSAAQHAAPDRDSLFTVRWILARENGAGPENPAGQGQRAASGPIAVTGVDEKGLAAALEAAGVDAGAYPDLDAIAEAMTAGAPAPRAVLAVLTGEPGDAAASGARLAGQALELVQHWLETSPLEGSALMVVTRGAVSTDPEEGVADLGAAPVWGLLRSAQAENPGRFALIDLDPGAAEVGLTAAVAAVLDGEPEVAVREGRVLARRLARPALGDFQGGGGVGGWDVDGTVLITGGTGTLGAELARHLVVSDRAGHVLLASRGGPAVPGVAGLAARLAGAGAAVTVTACDADSRPQLAALIAGVPGDRPLAAVVHAAGALDDGVVTALTPARIDTVMGPKASGAWHLHELTAGLDVGVFVLFSSAAASFGSPGQGNYAAANAFLDGLAAERRASGLPATSLAWGLWEQRSGITAHLTDRDAARLERAGMRLLETEQALKLFDTATALDEPLTVLAPLGPAALTADGPRLLAELAHRPGRGSASTDVKAGPRGGADEALRHQLAGMPAAGQEQLLLELVRAQAATVLGHDSADAVGPEMPFRELGFDSLSAVELRNQLATETGLRLPATAVFDYPAPVALSRFLRDELAIGLAEESGSAAPAPTPTPAAAPEEPVVIVGMGCRFPGGVADPEGLWKLVADGSDAVGPFPVDRGWDLDNLFHPDPDNAGTSYAREGGFVAEAADFDAGFFGISPREAVGMDPQQRLLLEVSWEALERAGIDPGTLRGTPVGVFAGATGYGYGAGVQGHGVTGGAGSVISGRVSYALGLEGPSMTVDTACSSSLVAMHLAAQALRSGECNLALVGGVTVMATPITFVEFSHQRGLASDGRCKAFGASADGVGWAEGAGMLVLERLSDARRAGHRVLAVVRGSAVNQDGASNGLTAPNGPSQQRVIRSALASARLGPADVDAVEAHGTGTTLGDPIEAQAVIAAYGQDRPEGRPLWLGSVKSNIGHSQWAAGVAGVIKMVQAMEHQVLPRTLHAEEPSPHVDWSAGDVRLLSEPVPWPAGDGRPRRAGVSSFGISGTNAHVILEEAPAREDIHPAPVVGADPVLAAGGPVAWLVSGRDVAGLAGQAGRLREFVAARPELDPVDVGYSLAVTRAALDHRAVVVGADRRELLAGLASVAVGQPGAGVVSGTAVGGGRSVLVFPGQGSQWVGMGVELARVSPVFAARLAECSGVLEPLTGWRLEDVLADGELLERVEVVQPALW